LHDHEVFAHGPAFTQPEGAAGGVVGVEENIALLNAEPAKAGERFVDERATEATPTVRGSNRQMVQVAAPTVVPTEDGADDDAGGVSGDKAQAGIANEEGGDSLPRIGFVETDAFA